MSKRYDEPVEVEMHGAGTSGGTEGFVAFQWRGNRYEIDRLIKRWREAGEGWDPKRAWDLEFYRVEARGGIYDLLFDRLAQGKAEDERPAWRLARVWD